MHRQTEVAPPVHLRNVMALCPDSGLQRGVDIAISDGTITAIGADLTPSPDAGIVEGKGALCLPGLVNSHNHSPLTVVRGMVEDLGSAPAYIPGVPQGHWLSPEETHAFARLGVMEMLAAGATTIVDYYRCPDALARAADELGVRALVGGRIMDADTAELAKGRFVMDPVLGEKTMRDAVDLFDAWEGHDRISTILAPHAPDTCSRRIFAEVADLAARTGRQVHTHLAQAPIEVEQMRAREGLSPVEFLDDVGLLNDELIAAHCIFMEPDDIRRFGAARAIVAHAPIGNASFGAAAPIVALRDAGARITLCTDTKSADLFEAMRMAIASARWRADMAFVLNAREVFGWATRDGAAALRGHGATGTLRVGGPADLILLDPVAPNLRPVIDGFGIVVHSANGANVTDAMVGGAWLMRDRRPTRVDPEEVIATAQAVAEAMWARAG